jgi:N-acylglucosamine-6-phosphate 2-epimerase
MTLALERGLIVSCQAWPDSPMRSPQIMAALAQAAVIGGAVAIRANGPADVAAIRAVVSLPLIGLYKFDIEGYTSYITPTLDTARQIADAGADILALDATQFTRPEGLTGPELIQRVKSELGIAVMADISTLEEGLAAAEAGADLVSTTMAGYTPYSRQQPGADFRLIADLASRVSVPVIAEGRIATPEDARLALQMGAYAVVVGAAITRPEDLTRRFVRALESMKGNS